MKKKKKYVTLTEMVIVMFIIGLIIGIVAYNYRGTLEEGKAFKTKMGIEKIRTILELKVAEDASALDDVSTRWKDYVAGSPLVQNPKTIVKDGWGQEYKVTVEGDRIRVSSDKFEEYKKTNPTMFKDDS